MTAADPTRALIDISPKITPDIAVWPGDSPVSREVLCHLDDGATVTLSTLRTTVHLGAHADGANHYGKGAGCIDTMPLERYIGPCHVVRARVERRPGGTRVAVADLDTPLSVYLKLAAGPYSYLLESVQGGEKWGRYSIIGLPCARRIEARGHTVRVLLGPEEIERHEGVDPLAFVDGYVRRERGIL
jgi:hypothetical protein